MASTFLPANPNDVTLPSNLFGFSNDSNVVHLVCGKSRENCADERLLFTELGSGLSRSEDESFTSAPPLTDHLTNHVTVFANFLLSFVICSGNILTVTAISKNHKLQTQPNFYIASLAGADIMMGVIVFVRGFSYIQETHRVFTFSPFACLVFLSFLYTSMAASIFSLVLVSLDRVINTSYCLLYESLMTPRTTKMLISATWIFAVVYGTVPLYTSLYPSRLLRCLPTQVLAKAYFLHVNSATFLVSSFVIIVCYLQIARIFLQHRTKIMQMRPGAIRPEENRLPERADVAETEPGAWGATDGYPQERSCEAERRNSNEDGIPTGTSTGTIKMIDTQDKSIRSHQPQADGIELETNYCAVNRGYNDDESQNDRNDTRVFFEIPRSSSEDTTESSNKDIKRELCTSFSKTLALLSEKSTNLSCKEVVIDMKANISVLGTALSAASSSETCSSTFDCLGRPNNVNDLPESLDLSTVDTRTHNQIALAASQTETLDTSSYNHISSTTALTKIVDTSSGDRAVSIASQTFGESTANFDTETSTANCGLGNGPFTTANSIPSCLHGVLDEFAIPLYRSTFTPSESTLTSAQDDSCVSGDSVDQPCRTIKILPAETTIGTNIRCKISAHVPTKTSREIKSYKPFTPFCISFQDNNPNSTVLCKYKSGNSSIITRGDVAHSSTNNKICGSHALFNGNDSCSVHPSNALQSESYTNNHLVYPCTCYITTAGINRHSILQASRFTPNHAPNRRASQSSPAPSHAPNRHASSCFKPAPTPPYHSSNYKSRRASHLNHAPSHAPNRRASHSSPAPSHAPNRRTSRFPPAPSHAPNRRAFQSSPAPSHAPNRRATHSSPAPSHALNRRATHSSPAPTPPNHSSNYISRRGQTSPETGQDIPSRLRAARLLATVCGIFLVCWTPLILSVLAFYTMGGTFEAISACTTLAVINSAINFFIYAAANNDFRQTFKRLLCRR